MHNIDCKNRFFSLNYNKKRLKIWIYISVMAPVVRGKSEKAVLQNLPTMYGFWQEARWSRVPF